MAESTQLIVGATLPAALGKFVRKHKPSSVFLVGDRRFKTLILRLQSTMPVPCGVFLIPGAEKSKRIKSFQDLITAMIDSGADRKTLIVAVGGGVVGDLAGFAASVYMRGIPWLSVPTTLLSMVDSGIGGKTAINHPKLKNSIGSFHKPIAAIIDTSFLKTHGRRELVSGMGEVLKYSLLDRSVGALKMDMKAVEKWSRRPVDANRLIRKCLTVKSKIVAADYRETSGQRALLNLGHTGAHAFESVSGFDFYRHGEAVILGLEMALRVSRIRGHLGKSAHDQLIHVLRRFPVPRLKSALSYQELWLAMRRDKKSESGKVKMVLLSGIGKPLVGQEISSSDVMLALIEMSEQGMVKIK